MTPWNSLVFLFRLPIKLMKLGIILVCTARTLSDKLV